MISTVKKVRLSNGTVLRIRHGNLTDEDCDCIVNAANENLRHGGGVAAAIVRAGGYIIQKESDDYISKYGSLRVTDVMKTTKGDLPCKKELLHAVGPIWDDDTPKRCIKQLKETIMRIMRAAKICYCDSVGMCAISSGIFGFPKDLCARVMINTIVDLSEEQPNLLPAEIRITNSDEPTVKIFKAILEAFLENPNDPHFLDPPVVESVSQKKKRCFYSEDCTLLGVEAHTNEYSHPCGFGQDCPNGDKSHLESFIHE